MSKAKPTAKTAPTVTINEMAAAVAAAYADSAKNAGTFRIPLDLIDFLPQVRTSSGLNVESINELASSLKEHGQLQPIIVHATEHQIDGVPMIRYTVTAGHRRVMAARVAQMADINAVVGTDEQASKHSIIQLVENVQREDLSTAEIAKALRAIYDAKPEITLDDLSKMLGKSKPWISKRLSTTFPDFSPFAKQLLESGEVSDIEIVHMMNQVDKAGAGFQLLADTRAKIIAGEFSRKDAKNLLEDIKAGRYDTPKPDGSAPAAAPAHYQVNDADFAGEDGEGREPGEDDEPATEPLAKIIDTIESRMRNHAFKQAKDYSDSQKIETIIELVKLVEPDYEIGKKYRNENSDDKLHGLASYAAETGGAINLAAWVNGASKRQHSMPEILRTLEGMAQAEKIGLAS